KVVLWASILVIGFHVKEKMMVERESMNGRLMAWIVCAVVLAGVDLAIECVRASRRKAA
ncbi:MAG: hypothetical protein HQL19_08120, partial [Candidatus Omnitrophica bacterium]|nr:hypothetical protein [Candidatus Omnitrophota bacterium]